MKRRPFAPGTSIAAHINPLAPLLPRSTSPPCRPKGRTGQRAMVNHAFITDHPEPHPACCPLRRNLAGRGRYVARPVRDADRLHGRASPATKAADRAGIEHAKQSGDRAYIGRKPSYRREEFNKARDMLGQQAIGIALIAKETGLTGR